jgi:hypothetical protein
MNKFHLGFSKFLKKLSALLYTFAVKYRAPLYTFFIFFFILAIFLFIISYLLMPIISKKLNFIDIFNIQDFFSNLNNYIMNLSYEQNLAFVNLSGIFVIMITLMSIVSIFYSNKLLNYFSLESHYPKFAKLILLRVKFQQYYLFINILIITIVSIVMFALNLSVFF